MANKNRFITGIYELLYNISPKLLLRLRFLSYFSYYRKFLSFKNPITLDEKIQWLKLNYYDGNKLICQCADKYAVRDYIVKCGCEDILVNLIGVYDNACEIDWDSLPNKFVVKWNFGCGHNLICRDKSQLDYDKATKILNAWKKDSNRFYKWGAEMQYKKIVPKLIIEEYIETENNLAPVDYKCYCFHGEPYCLLTCTGRESGRPKFYLVDKNWNLLRLNKAGLDAPDGYTPFKPDGYEQIFQYAKILSKDFPFVRADFYIERGKVYFGELTFSPGNGFDYNRLLSTNELFGSMLHLDRLDMYNKSI